MTQHGKKPDDLHSPRRERPSTYFVQDRSNLDEMTRLDIQDQIITTGMGGVLPEQSDPTTLQSVLDVGCGTGGWLIEVAKTYPNIQRLVGVDISSKMLDHAREQAEAQGVGDRVQFRVMDALLMLEFPTASFDLVNHRFAMSFLRTLDWPKLLGEYQRVCRPGGIVRITESDIITESSSPALLQLSDLFFRAASQAGHFFTSAPNGVTSELAHLMDRYQFQQVQTLRHVIDYRAGTEAGQLFSQDMERVFRNSVPYLRKWTRVPDDYDAIYQRAISEMQQPDFVATWSLLTAWGSTQE